MNVTINPASVLRTPERFFIGGEWVEPRSSIRLKVISPVTEEVLLTYPEASDADVDAAVTAARDAFDNGPWPRLAPAERAVYGSDYSFVDERERQGGGRTEGFDKGYFLEPTVFTDVTADMKIAREDIFGPVVSVITSSDEDHAIAKANDTVSASTARSVPATPSAPYPIRAPDGQRTYCRGGRAFWQREGVGYGPRRLPGPSLPAPTAEKDRQADGQPRKYHGWALFRYGPSQACRGLHRQV